VSGEPLARVERRFVVEQQLLIRLVGAAEGESDAARRRALVEYSLVALVDAWSRFSRDLILASCLGGTTTCAGVVLPLSSLLIRTRSAALTRIRSHFGRPHHLWWEPSWFDPVAASTAAGALAIPNGVTVTAALGASTNPIEEIRWVRNFVAHRGPGTAARCHAIGVKYYVPTPCSPTAIVLQMLPGAQGLNRRLFDLWCDRLRSIARNAAS
jgi:hypothetical protein